MITVRLAAGDLNRLLPADDSLSVRFVDGRFEITVVWRVFTVVALAHPDLRDGQLRCAVPLDELRGVPRPLAALFWGYLTKRADDELDAKLTEAGLPWDLVWVESYDDPKHGKVMTANIAPRTLNMMLRDKATIAGLCPRLAAVKIEPEAIVLTVQLIEPGADHAH